MAELCTVCGQGPLRERVASFTFAHNGKQAVIEDHQTYCDHCGNISYAGEQISRHEMAIAARIRELDGLLSAEDLRRIRLKYGFRQADMETMLSIGPKTWTRWERGKVPQSKAADTLIRVLAEEPEVARRLMEQAGIDNPTAAEVFARVEEDTKRLAVANLRSQIGPQMSDAAADDMAARAIDAVRAARQGIGVRAA